MSDPMVIVTARLEDEAGLAEPPTRNRRSQADQLVEFAEKVDLFHAPDQTAYATFEVGGHLETWPLRAKGFRRWLARVHHEVMGKVPGSQALQDALAVLEGRALFDGAERPVHVRVGHEDGVIYLDLGNSMWETVAISAEGWRVVTDPLIRFRRPSGLLALPHPIPGGDLAELRQYVNADAESWPLLLGFEVAVLSRGPYPVLNLLGEQGTAKSTTARVLRELIDPNIAAVRSEPREIRDLMIAATNSWLVVLDNLSSLRPWISDALCRLSTGGGFATRELYTDQDEVIFDAQRPVILTGIEELATRGDLVDRSVLVYLPTIRDADRLAENTLWRAFYAARPRILGALLDAASLALRRAPEIVLESPPRMADFTQFVVAAEPALGLAQGTFLVAYEANRRAGDELAVEASPVGQAVLELMKGRTSPWEGTASELLEELNLLVPEDRKSALVKAKLWPGTARGLSGRLRRLAPNLRRLGLTVIFPSRTARERLLVLEWVGPQPSQPSQPSLAGVPEAAGHDGNDGSDGRLPLGSDSARPGCPECGGSFGHMPSCSRGTS